MPDSSPDNCIGRILAHRFARRGRSHHNYFSRCHWPPSCSGEIKAVYLFARAFLTSSKLNSSYIASLRYPFPVGNVPGNSFIIFYMLQQLLKVHTATTPLVSHIFFAFLHSLILFLLRFFLLLFRRLFCLLFLRFYQLLSSLFSYFFYSCLFTVSSLFFN